MIIIMMGFFFLLSKFAFVMDPVNHHLKTDWIIHTVNAVSPFY